MNGVKEGTASSVVTDGSSAALRIGSDSAGNSVIKGSIDDVRIYNYIRTPAQVAWEYNQGKPVAHYKLDECTGTTAYDSSGFNNHGTINIAGSGSQTSAGNCATVDTATAWYNGRNGKYNSSLNFDGTDDYVNVLNTHLITTNDWTISTWVKPNNYTGADSTQKFIYLNGDDQNAALSGFALSMQYNTGNPQVDVVVGANSAELLLGPSPLPTDEWTNLIAVKNGTTLTLYVNTVPANSTLSSATMDYSADNIHTRIGTSTTGSGDFPGLIDDVRIYNYPLTPAQIRTVYNEGSAIRFGPLTGSP